MLLNVYDLNKKINKYTGKLGLGLYHSGVQVWSLTVEFYSFHLFLQPRSGLSYSAVGSSSFFFFRLLLFGHGILVLFEV